jgi:hypothetical protein
MNYLLSVENLKKLGLIHMNTDVKILAVSIKRSQDMHLQPALGTPLYKALLNRVETSTWTADYLLLMNDYVIPCLVAFVDFRSAAILNEKLTNKAVGRQSDETMTANTDTETAHLRDMLRKDAYFYKQRLIGFLKDDNGVKYPEYSIVLRQ